MTFENAPPVSDHFFLAMATDGSERKSSSATARKEDKLQKQKGTGKASRFLSTLLIVLTCGIISRRNDNDDEEVYRKVTSKSNDNSSTPIPPSAPLDVVIPAEPPEPSSFAVRCSGPDVSSACSADVSEVLEHLLQQVTATVDINVTTGFQLNDPAQILPPVTPQLPLPTATPPLPTPSIPVSHLNPAAAPYQPSSDSSQVPVTPLSTLNPAATPYYPSTYNVPSKPTSLFLIDNTNPPLPYAPLPEYPQWSTQT
ncbi:uncharacterized protein [Branchiostoma lanceolatum]|uniref:uncharacterized protein n=1 Tax=Branchiostoma lanceolatum TaxID=7740 RepID=UPI003454E604